MADDDTPTQPTQPRSPDAEPVEIPVPTREDVMRDLAKIAPPVPEPAKRDDD
jgi:hypothetical protein